jgi:TolA-binding protein
MKGFLELPRSHRSIFPAALVSVGLFMGGCHYFLGSFEAAQKHDQAGKTDQAIAGYQNFLKKSPESGLASIACYRIAKNYEAQSDFTNAISWFEKTITDHPRTDEEIHALFDMASLYHDKLKNPAKSVEYNQKAFARYMDNAQIRDAIQSLIEAQYQTATAFFVQKNYRNAADALEGVFKTYPSVFISPDTRAKLDSLADRSRRAEAISKASVDMITLKSEGPFNKSFETDFPLADGDDNVLSSPDGTHLAARRKAPNGIFYLYVAKVPAKGDKAVFKLIPQTFGADRPAWSPDGRELVYWKTNKSNRKLEKTDITTLATQTLFYTQSDQLGKNPAYHPAGNKIAYIYEGKVCLINTGGLYYKSLLKTKQKLDYTAELTWSMDGTMIRCRGMVKPGKVVDQLLELDVSSSNNPPYGS